MTEEEVKGQIIEYIKAYNNGGEPIAAYKIVSLLKAHSCECPLCHGNGRLTLFESGETNGDLKHSAKVLRGKGFTIREIASKLGFKHPGSISHLLKSKMK